MFIIIRMKSNTANLIPFATAAMVRYSATYEFYEPYGTKSEYLSVIFKDVKPKEVDTLLKQYGLLKSKKQYVLLK